MSVGRAVGYLSFLVVLGACGGKSPAYADRVIGMAGNPGLPFGDPSRAANGARGAGRFAGSTDVFSLDQSKDGTLTLAWSRGPFYDGPGADLVVFENAFARKEDPQSIYFEPVVVSVSADGEHYAAFPHRYLGPHDESGDETTSRRAALDRRNWQGFAGMTPVLYHEEENGPAQGVSPFDTARAGGDAFDLTDLGESPLARGIREKGARFVKLLAAQVVSNPDSAVSKPEASGLLAGARSCFPKVRAGYADIDGVYARYFNKEKK